MSALSRLVSDRMAEQGWSAHEVARRGDERGARLSVSTVARIARGVPGEVKLPTLYALSTALNLPPQDLLDAAGAGKDLGPWTPPEEARLLGVEDRRMLDSLVRRLAMGVATRN